MNGASTVKSLKPGDLFFISSANRPERFARVDFNVLYVVIAVEPAPHVGSTAITAIHEGRVTKAYPMNDFEVVII